MSARDWIFLAGGIGAISLLSIMLVSFAQAFVAGFNGYTEREIQRRVDERLAAENVLRVGDRMRFSGVLLRQLHRVGDGEQVIVEVAGIGVDGDGSKIVTLRNEPQRSGEAFWKHRV